MSALTGMSASPRPKAPQTAVVANDGWWPDIDLEHLKNSVRLPAGVTDQRLVESAANAVLDVNNELAKWQDARIVEGATVLGDVVCKQVNDEHSLTVRYRRAVYSTVDADLLENYINTDSTGRADKRFDELKERMVTARRNKRWAISAILNHAVKKHRKIHVSLV